MGKLARQPRQPIQPCADGYCQTVYEERGEGGLGWAAARARPKELPLLCQSLPDTPDYCKSKHHVPATVPSGANRLVEPTHSTHTTPPHPLERNARSQLAAADLSGRLLHDASSCQPDRRDRPVAWQNRPLHMPLAFWSLTTKYYSLSLAVHAHLQGPTDRPRQRTTGVWWGIACTAGFLT